jgi:hypothetical protein
LRHECTTSTGGMNWKMFGKEEWRGYSRVKDMDKKHVRWSQDIDMWQKVPCHKASEGKQSGVLANGVSWDQSGLCINCADCANCALTVHWLCELCIDCALTVHSYVFVVVFVSAVA